MKELEKGVLNSDYSQNNRVFLRVSYFCSFFSNIHPDIYGRRNSENAGYSERKILSKPGTGPADGRKTS
ncbi:MAG: hypothetical protein LUQ36_11715 [Methanoregula sp.]|nr:hypothetical protein [Methanoregula sp.]